MWAAIAQLIPMVLQMMQGNKQGGGNSDSSGGGGMGGLMGGGEKKSSTPQYPSILGGGSGMGMAGGNQELFKYQPGSMSSALMNMYNRQRGLA
jgi:hypothetical protein